MTPRQQSCADFRMGLFQRRGLSGVRAAALVERLTFRDSDGDDRRVCPECAHLVGQWRCAKNESILLDVLQRCPAFKWEVPKQ